jgi:hypothetical protein
MSTSRGPPGMKVNFVSRSRMRQLIIDGYYYSKQQPKDKADIISISSTHGDKNKMRELWNENRSFPNCGLFMVFYDVDSDLSRFTENKARQIIEFVNTSHRKGAKSIDIHCDMGISRSGAVAKWVNEYLGLQNLYLDDYTRYNRFVYEKLCYLSGVQTLKNYYGGY